jgi:hypothetical protein
MFPAPNDTPGDTLVTLWLPLLAAVPAPAPPPPPQANTKKQKYDKISERKMKTSIDSLCRGLPQEFAHYFQYVR